MSVWSIQGSIEFLTTLYLLFSVNNHSSCQSNRILDLFTVIRTLIGISTFFIPASRIKSDSFAAISAPSLPLMPQWLFPKASMLAMMFNVGMIMLLDGMYLSVFEKRLDTALGVSCNYSLLNL